MYDFCNNQADALNLGKVRSIINNNNINTLIIIILIILKELCSRLSQYVGDPDETRNYMHIMLCMMVAGAPTCSHTCLQACLPARWHSLKHARNYVCWHAAMLAVMFFPMPLSLPTCSHACTLVYPLLLSTGPKSGKCLPTPRRAVPLSAGRRKQAKAFFEDISFPAF